MIIIALQMGKKENLCAFKHIVTDILRGWRCSDQAKDPLFFVQHITSIYELEYCINTHTW